MKILVVVFWNPNNTEYIREYFLSLEKLLTEGRQLFFVTTFDTGEAYKEKIEGLKKATRYCFENGFSHMLILGEGIFINEDDLEKLVVQKQSVTMSMKDTLNCCLLKTAVLRTYPFVYAGEFSSPDRLWLKLVKQKGIKLSFTSGIKHVYLESVVGLTTNERSF